MKYETLKNIRGCTSEIEARMKCTLFGERFDHKEYRRMQKMEEWEKTLWLYNKDCEERGIRNVLA